MPSMATMTEHEILEHIIYSTCDLGEGMEGAKYSYVPGKNKDAILASLEEKGLISKTEKPLRKGAHPLFKATEAGEIEFLKGLTEAAAPFTGLPDLEHDSRKIIAYLSSTHRAKPEEIKRYTGIPSERFEIIHRRLGERNWIHSDREDGIRAEHQALRMLPLLSKHAPIAQDAPGQVNELGLTRSELAAALEKEAMRQAHVVGAGWGVRAGIPPADWEGRTSTPPENSDGKKRI